MTPQEPQALLTPAMRGVIQRMARAGRPPLHSLPAHEARAAYALGAGVLDVPSRPMARVQELAAPARDGHAIGLRLVAPASDQPLPLLIYYHGGGFTIGSIATHDTLCRELAHRARCAVISVEYRLAPEHPFPAAQDDAWDALTWLAGQGSALGLDTTRLAVGGDSAGGTLATVCAIRARDAALPLALQLLFYPGCAAFQETPSQHRFAEGFVLDYASIRWFFDQVLPNEARRADWRFAPLNAADVDGVAPAWLGLAECDPLVDEGILYADKLRAAGVAVDLEIYRGVVHEFIKMGRAIPEALQAHADAARALAAALGTAGDETA